MRLWTLGRAAGIGVPAGLVALVLWPIYARTPSTLIPFAAALGIAAFCGLSMIAFSLFDIATRRRGIRVRPARAFDLLLGLLLAGPSLIALDALVEGIVLHP